jgi:hypothetical protein
MDSQHLDGGCCTHLTIATASRRIESSGRKMLVSTSVELNLSSRQLLGSATQISLLRMKSWKFGNKNCILRPEVQNFAQAGCIESSGWKLIRSTSVELSPPTTHFPASPRKISMLPAGEKFSTSGRRMQFFDRMFQYPAWRLLLGLDGFTTSGRRMLCSFHNSSFRPENCDLPNRLWEFSTRTT